MYYKIDEEYVIIKGKETKGIFVFVFWTETKEVMR